MTHQYHRPVSFGIMARPDLDLHYDHQDRYVTLSLSGKISHRDITTAFEEVVNNPRFHQDMPRIWDFREVDMSGISVEEMNLVGYRHSKYRADVNQAKVAFVTPKKLEYGMSRVLSMEREVSGGARAETFRSLEDAVAWALE